MFEYFTPLAKRAIVASQDEAITLGHDFIGPEHLLLGLIGTIEGTAGRVLAEQGLQLAAARTETVRLQAAVGIGGDRAQAVKDALSTIGIDIAQIQQRADDTFGPGAFQFPRPAYTPVAKKVLTQTLRQAKRRHQQEHIGTEHMLLSLLTEPDTVAMQVLTAFDVSPQALRSALPAHT